MHEPVQNPTEAYCLGSLNPNSPNDEVDPEFRTGGEVRVPLLN